MISGRRARNRGGSSWHERPYSSVTIAEPRLEKERAPRFVSPIPMLVAERRSPICATTVQEARRAAAAARRGRRPEGGRSAKPSRLRVGRQGTTRPRSSRVRALAVRLGRHRPGSKLGWTGAAGPARRAGERRQGRGSARSLRRRARPGPVPRRSQPRRGRAGRARPARRGAGAARGLDRDVRRPLPSRDATGGHSRAGVAIAGAARPRRRPGDLADARSSAWRPRHVSAASPRALADALGELEAGARRARATSTATSARSIAAYRLEMRAPRHRGPPAPCGGGPQSSSRPISEHGTRLPSWSTASRT